MGKARGYLANTVVKVGGAGHATGAGAVTIYPVDLDSLTTGQRPTWCKIIFAAQKTTGGTLSNVALTPLTGTTSSPATGMTHYPISVPVASDVTHGAVAAGGTGETGRYTQVYDIDLMDSQVRTWLGCTCTISVTSSDTLDWALVFVFGGFNELPVTNTAMATMA